MTIQHQIAVAEHREKADFILRNATVADVFSLVWRQADIVVANGRIIAIDDQGIFDAHETMDACGRHVIPGLIDGHIHIESTLLTPSEFSRVLLPHGVTAAITDPHEIANVAGSDGIQYMLDDAKSADMDIFVMLPSSVPSTSFENAGARLEAEHLTPFFDDAAVLGLAEVMDYPAVLSGDEQMLKKLEHTHHANLVIDGHCAGLTSAQITGYRAAHIATDHECVTADEARDRVMQGMHVLIREGSAAKNLHDLLPAVTAANARRFGFCTDDKYVDEIIAEGTIDHAIRLAIQAGMEPLQAIQLGSLNVAECYGLKERGALAAGFIADFVIVDDIESMTIATVFKEGQLVAQNGAMTTLKFEAPIPAHIQQSVHLPAVTADHLAIPMNTAKANVIEIIPNQIMTKHLICDVESEHGFFVPSIEQDLLKLVVIERHHQLHTTGHAIVRGFGLQAGAIATTVAHDSHNALALGTNDADMLIALARLEAINGGVVIVKDGVILAEMALPIGGLMTALDGATASIQLRALHEALLTLNPQLNFHLLLTLSFIALPVIPTLKITDTGLFNVTTFEHISIEYFDESMA